MKGPIDTTTSTNSIELANLPAVNEKHGTQRDESDMDRMGKIQQLKVRFDELYDTEYPMGI